MGNLVVFTLDVQASNWVCADKIIVAHSNELAKVKHLKIFPDPTGGEIFIDLKNDGQFTLQVFDMTGRLLFQREKYRANQSIELKGFKNGLYYVLLTGLGRTYVGKVVVQR